MKRQIMRENCLAEKDFSAKQSNSDKTNCSGLRPWGPGFFGSVFFGLVDLVTKIIGLVCGLFGFHWKKLSQNSSKNVLLQTLLLVIIQID